MSDESKWRQFGSARDTLICLEKKTDTHWSTEIDLYGQFQLQPDETLLEILRHIRELAATL